MRKKGTARDIVFIMIILFIFAIGFFVVHSVMNTMTDQMMNMSVFNESNATMNVLQGGKDVANRMDYVVLGLFVGLVLGLIITSWFVGGIPIFMFVYFLVVVITVVASTVLSNIWESVSGASIFGTTINSFTITNHLMVNLPIYMGVVGFIGLVVMFAKPAIQKG